MSYDLYFFAAVSLLCIVVGRMGLIWKAALDRARVTRRDPPLFVDAATTDRQARLSAMQAPEHRHTILSMAERRREHQR